MMNVLQNKLLIRIKESKKNTDECVGEIQIGEFKESFLVSLDSWTIKDYEKQWKEGIERIKTHDVSCLVANVQELNVFPVVNLWVLYKKGNIIYIQNNLLLDEIFKNLDLPDLSQFNKETCYQYIKPRETVNEDGYEISEWQITLDEIN